MSEPTLRQTIYNRLSAITNIGLVYDYERWANDWSVMVSLFTTTINSERVVRGWTIACEGIDPATDTGRKTFGQSYRGTTAFIYHYKIRGYYGLDDAAASEKSALALAIQVRDEMEKHFNAAGDDSIFSNSPALLFQPRVFGDVLCHYAEISLDIHQVQRMT